MKLKEFIEKLQEIDAKYDRDLEVVTLSEIGIVKILDIQEALYTSDDWNASDDWNEEFELLSENPDLRVNSVYLAWN